MAQVTGLPVSRGPACGALLELASLHFSRYRYHDQHKTGGTRSSISKLMTGTSTLAEQQQQQQQQEEEEEEEM